MESCKKNIRNDYIDELRKEFDGLSFNRTEKVNGMFVTNSINLDFSNDRNIFLETQAKRAFRSSVSFWVPEQLKRRLQYFSQSEDEKGELYKYDGVQNLANDEEFAIQNIGHATQLIQISGFNILTDPVFNSLNTLLYPAKAESYPAIVELPKIDVIIISHNHRDHIDQDSLKQLLHRHNENLWRQPKVFVPLGDKKLVETFGYTEIEEVDWYTKISVNKQIDGMDKTVGFISIPADHRSGRYGLDHHESLVTGWLIVSQLNDVIFKFSGDTRPLLKENQMAVDAWYEIKNKINQKHNINTQLKIPDLIFFEPSGPNYTHSYMDVTHQSTSYSALLKIQESENLSKLSGRSMQKFLDKTKTIMMHHYKFELGPDRFNEGFFVFKKLIQYMDLGQNLAAELKRQRNKLVQNLDKVELKKNTRFASRPFIASLPTEISLLVHAKDFIIEELQEVIDKGFEMIQIKEYLIKNTLFPKIGERINNKDMFNVLLNLNNIHKYRGRYKSNKYEQ